MSKLVEIIDKYKAEAKKLNIPNLDEALLERVTRKIGPSIYKKDAASVSCGDPAELGRVKKNLLMKKFGLADGPELDAPIQEACEMMGKSNRNKYRAIFYYILAKKFGKESLYS